MTKDLDYLFNFEIVQFLSLIFYIIENVWGWTDDSPETALRLDEKW